MWTAAASPISLVLSLIISLENLCQEHPSVGNKRCLDELQAASRI